MFRSVRNTATIASIIAYLAGCASVPESATPPAQSAVCPPLPAAVEKPSEPTLSWSTALRPTTWENMPGWDRDRLSDAWGPFMRSCAALTAQSAWQPACEAAVSVDGSDNAAVRAFFQAAFVPYQVVNLDGSTEGTITGYYEPVIRGSRARSPIYRFPVYGVPDDLLVVDLSELYPDLKHMRLRGRLDGNRVVPYYNRADIESGKAAVAGRELLWTDDAVDLFFLQIQGSGRVKLDTGETVRLSYADQNGHPYSSVGRLLVERGELTLDQASMRGIKAWGARNPNRLQSVLDQNASYVFFHETPDSGDGPTGALSVPLTAGRSLAIDRRAIPLGAPVFLSTTFPNSSTPLNRLMVAQDTGGAIKGAVRADFFWGSGHEAGIQAGRMRQTGKLWVLLPKEFPLASGS